MTRKAGLKFPATAIAALVAGGIGIGGIADPIDAWAQGTSTVDLRRATQTQVGPLQTQSLDIGNAQGNGAAKASVGSATQVQSGTLNKQSMDIGNAEGNGRSDAHVGSASALLVADAIDAQVAGIDAALGDPGLEPDARERLWQARVDALQQAAGFESTQRLLASGGHSDALLVAVD